MDWLSGWLLPGMTVFGPWAFGTAESWSALTMDIASYVLGALLIAKLLIRFLLGCKPARWSPSPKSNMVKSTAILAALTLLLLGYTIISVLNVRADYDPVRLTMACREYFQWLPHSYHRTATGRALCDSVAWAFVVWALRDWLGGWIRRKRVAPNLPWIMRNHGICRLG
jgi:hypothetical protein